MTDLSDDELAALQESLEAWYRLPEGDESISGEALWRAAGRYYLEMAAKICEQRKTDLDGIEDAAYNRALTWCAKAIRKREIEPTPPEPIASVAQTAEQAAHAIVPTIRVPDRYVPSLDLDWLHQVADATADDRCARALHAAADEIAIRREVAGR